MTKLIFLFLLPMGATAATFGDEMNAVGLGSYLWVVVLSMAGGIYNALAKISGDMGLRAALLDIVKDMIVSLLAGLVAFFLAEGAGTPFWFVGGAVTVSGYAGAKALDGFQKRFFDSPTR